MFSTTIKSKTATLLAAAALFAVTTSATIVHYAADFKGEWAFNEKKSKLAEGNFRMNTSKLKVTQDAASLGVERTSASPNGEELVTTEKLTFDGKESESTVFNDSKKKSTAAWSSDGEALTVTANTHFEFNGNGIDIKSVEVWKLSEGGKTLSIATTTTSPRGTTENTFVYDKK